MIHTAKFLRILIVAVLCGWANVVSPSTLFDEELDSAIQGAWCNSEDGGKTCVGYDFFESGKSTYCGVDAKSGQRFSGTSNYAIHRNTLCHVVSSVDNEPFLKVGDRVCFLIVNAQPDLLVFRELTETTFTRLYRDRITKSECPKGGV
jgi:hypothetical protein